jgi:hypothetical protein
VTTSLVDYILRPVLVGKESRSHPLLFLIGLIGGIEIFGGIGVLAGPLIMMFFASVLRIYRRDVVDPIRRGAVRKRAPTTGGWRRVPVGNEGEAVRAGGAPSRAGNDTAPDVVPISPARAQQDTLPSASSRRAAANDAERVTEKLRRGGDDADW